MASEQVVVAVRRADAVVDAAIRRPVRLTPDGYAGVVFDGAVYPLLLGNQIDIDGPSWEPEDAKGFLIAGAPIPYAPATGERGVEFLGFAGEWHLETTRFGHYVLFDASERVAGTLVEALEGGGLAVQRWDVSHRVADNGRHYDWFARLRYRGEREDALSRVRDIFALRERPSQPDPLPPSELDRVEQLLDRVEELVGQLATMQGRLATSDFEMSALRGRLDTESERAGRLEEMLAKSVYHQQALAEALTSASVRDETDADVEANEIARQQAEEMLEFALADNAELERQVASLTSRSHTDAERLKMLDENLSHANGLLAELGAEERRRNRMRIVIPPRGVVAFVQAAFPRIDFVLDSMEIIDLFESTQALVRTLVQIDQGEMVGKDLEGIAGWHEVSKIATGIAGSESLGRIYYRPGGKQVQVCIHIKQDEKEQGRVIRRLGTL